ncbi:PPE family protein, SVP subgroup [Candidatus Mycobacterium methanotrophicum]|uniref:PPE domain-containing protein n=1 Tax=Candidatus Mycobacterium methanotrophicum TaxID=2943498 RepID=A0ABY4QHK8_9MYCO|nr:PPE domain-containing protein [Candidatus Mycobacterium methanotrophicum]UQX10505.1 PPE domain-containing protein [Candidatus Mycobacterium methanotrophicum]
MDFGIYPPEINSGRMYAGPGSGPMLAAAQAWAGLADELYTAAGAYQSVVAELTGGPWSGPSSASMTAAAVSYVAWLSATAARAEQTAAQARSAAAAYESAFASTVPPPVIAANRSLLLALVATNFFGQNTPAIAATEAHYAEMWAQDAAAMYCYAGSSAAATALTPFSSPHQSTDPGGTASQADAVGQAASGSAGDAQSIVSGASQTFSAAPNALQGAATSGQSTSLSDALGLLSELEAIFTSAPADVASLGATPLSITSFYPDFSSLFVQMHTDDVVSEMFGEASGSESALVTPMPSATIANPGPSVSAGLGEANTVAGLSVPSNWTVAAPEIRSVALTSPLTGPAAAAAPAVEAGSANAFNQMGLAGMAGQAMAGPPATDEGQDGGKPVAHARLTGRAPGVASDDDADVTPAPRTVVTGVAAAIRQIAKLRDEGRLSEQEYKEQKKRLLEVSLGHRPLG